MARRKAVHLISIVPPRIVDDMTFEAALAQLTDYPTGTSDDWLERYEALIDDVLSHHERATRPRVSAVVVAYQAEDYLLECLDHLRDQVGLEPVDIEIVLVDNGGNEKLRPTFASRCDVEVRMRGNVHTGRARNVGAAVASAPVIAFIDDDGIVECDYFRNALRYFEDVLIVGLRSRIVAREHPYFTTLAGHYSRGTEVVEDCLITEGSSFVRTAAFIEAKGFAEEIWGHEGIDLSYRLLERPGARLIYAPDVVMHHDYLDSWAKFGKKTWRHASVENRARLNDPKLADFMEDYFARSFDHGPMTVDQKVAREGLKFLRAALTAAATVKGMVGKEQT